MQWAQIMLTTSDELVERRSLAEIRKCQSDSAEKVASIGIIMLVKSTRGNAPPRGIWQRVGALASASARYDLARFSLSLTHKYRNKNTGAILTLPTFSSANPLPPATVTVADVFSFYNTVGDLRNTTIDWLAFSQSLRDAINCGVYEIKRMQRSF